MITTATAATVHTATLTDRGASLASDGTAPTAGYGVGGAADEAVYALADFTADHVWLFASRNADALAAGAVLGSWVDEETGRVHLDATNVVADLEAAMILARARGEIAVWDFAAGAEIRLEA